jgi:hypothetical protein
LNLYAQDTASIKIEYRELLEDIGNYRFFGGTTIPYYTNSQYYDRTDSHWVDVDNDLAFAIMGPGFVKFIDEKGNVRYSRFLWLYEGQDGLYSIIYGKCADEFSKADGVFYKPDGSDFYWITAYLPKPGTRIVRNLMAIEMDDVIPVERMVTSRKLNTSMIDLVYTANRMMEILYILKQHEPESLHIYEFKIKTLKILLNYIIEDRYEVDREYKSRLLNKQRVLQEDFIEMHPYFPSILSLLPFLELER